MKVDVFVKVRITVSQNQSKWPNEEWPIHWDSSPLLEGDHQPMQNLQTIGKHSLQAQTTTKRRKFQYKIEAQHFHTF